VLVTALAGCAGVERQGPAAADDAVVRLVADSVTLLLDNTQPLAVTRTDADGHPAPARLQWRSGDQSVAVVDSMGTVTAVGLGRTWIEVSDTRHTDTALVRTYLRLAAIHAGEDFTCALALGGQAACWGRNTYGSLGDGKRFDRSEPGLVDGGQRFSVLSVGAGSACGLAAILYCWGYNGVGQLGDGTMSERLRPVRVADTHSLEGVGLGSGTTTCAFEQGPAPEPVAPGRTAGPAPVLLCWGWNGYGQMLDGGGVNPHRPKVVETGKDVVAVATGGHHVCALDDTGAAWCWGRNDEGQLGDSTFTRQLSPAAVSGGHTFDQLTAGIAHTCGRAIGGQVWCWGSNGHGQLGAGGQGAPTPQLVAGGMTFDTIVASAYHTCGLHAGAAWCWGENAAHQLGRAGPGDQPAEVSGGLRFMTISAGWNHTCGIGTDGYAYCWGDNLHGELGAAASPDGYSPVRVAGQH
jgi:alpha-tubulin suppressor-like RCC1 family protein